GGRALAGDFDADYWARHIRQPTRFHRAAQAAVNDGITRFIEIGPHPVLLGHLATVAGREFDGRETLHRETGASSLIGWLAQECGAPRNGSGSPTGSGNEPADFPGLLALIGRLLGESTGPMAG